MINRSSSFLIIEATESFKFVLSFNCLEIIDKIISFINKDWLITFVLLLFKLVDGLSTILLKSYLFIFEKKEKKLTKLYC